MHNRAMLQWHAQRRKLCFVPIDETLKIPKNAVINTIQNTSGLNVVCRRSASCGSINEWRGFAETATFFGLKRNHSTSVKTL